MDTLVIDSGSYSVKFLKGSFQKKEFIVSEGDEILIEDVRGGDKSLSIEAIQQIIIKQYLEDTDFTGKIVNQVPHGLLTTRFIDFPTNQRKKAELMTPFMLDEDLPFPAANAHIVTTYFKNVKNEFSAMAQVSETSYFRDYFDMLKLNKTLPSLLTSELSTYLSYVDDIKFGNHFCIIDMGHENTKAYLGYNDRIMTNHVSSIAGKKIDEAISSTYGISQEEARIFKHEEAFFLTHSLMDKVDEDKKNFALLMKKNFDPLLSQLHRWILGYRIKTGFSIQKIYICGGTANIENIKNFLSEQLEIQVEHLEHSALHGFREINQASFTTPYIMGLSTKLKMNPSNFLTREFATGLSNAITLEDSAFNVFRASVIVFILVLSVLIETFVINSKEEKTFLRSNITMAKAKELDDIKSLKALIRKKPEKALLNLKKKLNNQEKDLDILEFDASQNAMRPLTLLSDTIKSNVNISLIDYQSDLSSTNAKFKAESEKDYKQLIELIRKLDVDNLKLKEDESDKTVLVTFNMSM